MCTQIIWKTTPVRVTFYFCAAVNPKDKHRKLCQNVVSLKIEFNAEIAKIETTAPYCSTYSHIYPDGPSVANENSTALHSLGGDDLPSYVSTETDTPLDLSQTENKMISVKRTVERVQTRPAKDLKSEYHSLLYQSAVLVKQEKPQCKCKECQPLSQWKKRSRTHK